MAPKSTSLILIRKGKKNSVACRVTENYDPHEVHVTTIIAEGQPDIEVMQCFNRSGQQPGEQCSSVTVCKQVFESKEAMESLAAIRDPLCLALQKGNVEISKLLIKAGRDVNFLKDYRTPMSYALDSAECTKEIIQLVFDAGFPKNGIVHATTQETTLHVAASKNFIDVVKYLLSISVDVNAKDVNGRTPLHAAVKRNNSVIVELLVKHGAQINCECTEKFTPLFYAIITGNCDMVKLLIKLGADLNHLSSNPKCSLMPLHLGAFLGQVNIVQSILDSGVDVNKKLPITGEIALHLVARAEVLNDKLKDKNIISMKRMAELLVKSGSDLKMKQATGFTPLQTAVRSNNITVANYLIRCGSQLNDKIYLQENDEDGQFTTTFHLIAKTLDKELIKTSLEYGADWRLRDWAGLYPCQVALQSYINDEKKMARNCALLEIVRYHQEKLFIFRLFWNYGFPYELTTLEGSDSPIPAMLKPLLHRQKVWFSSLKHLNKGLMKKALCGGAQANCCNTKLFKFPLHNVVVLNCEKIYETMLQERLLVNSLNADGETPLQVAARLGSYECCVLLLQHGAAYNACSARCPKTPLELAEEYNPSEEITDLFENIDECFKSLDCAITINMSEPTKTDVEKKFWAIMNCTGKDGLTLIGRALKLGLKKKALKLMKFKLRRNLKCITP